MADKTGPGADAGAAHTVGAGNHAHDQQCIRTPPLAHVLRTQQQPVRRALPPALALRSLQEVVLSRTGFAGATDSECTGAMHPATGGGAA